jgi:hypothetical protein
LIDEYLISLLLGFHKRSIGINVSGFLGPNDGDLLLLPFVTLQHRVDILALGLFGLGSLDLSVRGLEFLAINNKLIAEF